MRNPQLSLKLSLGEVVMTIGFIVLGAAYIHSSRPRPVEPKPKPPLRRMSFRMNEDNEDNFREFLCRLMPVEATTVQIREDGMLHVTCYMTDEEVGLMRKSMPEVRSEKEYVSAAVEEFISSVEGQA